MIFRFIPIVCLFCSINAQVDTIVTINASSYTVAQEEANDGVIVNSSGGTYNGTGEEYVQEVEL